MPHRLKTRQKKIQDKRKATPWREFVMEIGSWKNMVLARNGGFISRYPSARVSRVHDLGKWYSDESFSISDVSFFKQFFHLFSSISKPSLVHFYSNENADFSDSAFGGKNIYLSFEAGDNAENIAYSNLVYTNVSDIYGSCFVGNNSSNVFASTLIGNSSSIFWSCKIYDSDMIYYSRDLAGCHECIFSFGLRNVSYYIGNKHYEKEEYFARKRKIMANHKAAHDVFLEKIAIHPIDTNHNCHNCEHIMQSNFMSDSRNIIFGAGGDGSSRCYDSMTVGLNSSSIYACVAVGDFSEHLYCSVEVGKSQHLFYCYHMESCSHCLGCVGLKNKSYCIFNKQYTKEERYDKVDEIFSQMEKDGDLGKFFPGSMNPFYFNDTAAYLIDDTFTKEEVEAKGYMWRDEPIQVDIPAGAKVVKTKDLDQYEGFVISTEVERSTDTKPRFLDAASLHSKGHDEVVWHIDPEILNVIIQDEEGNVYRIIPMEYKFLKKHGLPLPRKHWLERLKDNFRIQ